MGWIPCKGREDLLLFKPDCWFLHEAGIFCHVTMSVLVCAGEVGAAHLLLPLWYIPVQQCERERRETHSGTDLFCLVFAAGSKQSLQKPALLLPVRLCMYPSFPTLQGASL